MHPVTLAPRQNADFLFLIGAAKVEAGDERAGVDLAPIGEDRGIEDYGRLRALVNGDRIYPRLAQLFEQADDRYNSGLFHFKKEPNRHEAPDELTL